MPSRWAQLLHNLSLTVTERLLQLDQLTRLSERLHGKPSQQTPALLPEAIRERQG